jgi:K+ transporter
MKVLQGGWVALVVAALMFFPMHPRWRGRRELLGVLERDTFLLRSFIAWLMTRRGCAVPPFM